MTKPKNPDLPAELRKSIRIDELLVETQKRKRARLDHRGIVTAEIKRRVSLLAQNLDMSWPEDEEAWLKLVVAICSRWKVPGFQLAATGSGAKKKWSVWKNLELVFDVYALVAENKRSSEYGACQYIAAPPEKYEERYPLQAGNITSSVFAREERTSRRIRGPLAPATFLGAKLTRTNGLV